MTHAIALDSNESRASGSMRGPGLETGPETGSMSHSGSETVLYDRRARQQTLARPVSQVPRVRKCSRWVR